MVKNKIRKSLLEQGQLLPKKFVLQANKDIQSLAIKEIDIETKIPKGISENAKIGRMKFIYILNRYLINIDLC